VLAFATVGSAPACTSAPAGAPPAETEDSRPAPDLEPELPAGDDATVVRIVDGDTLEVGDDERVRLIGIDTPEVHPGECYADEASRHLEQLLPRGTAVRLSYDAERHDRYGRTLAYVYRQEDGLHANVAMARDGFALQLTIPPNVAHADEISESVTEARAEARGLWGAGCETAPPPPAAAAVAAGDSCDPAYPTLCLPPGAADLDCSDIPERHFPVLAPDPHRLDGSDGDGVGCESP
jgi:micrococcal nuclease